MAVASAIWLLYHGHMTPDGDQFNLQRFVDAQAPAVEQVRGELAAGRKQTHWMWFVFPQIHGLGTSDMARRYAIGSRAEAGAYLAHPVLGPRLRDFTAVVAAIPDRSAREIFGPPDDLKFRSSITLFAAVSPADSVFHQALNRYFDGTGDSATLDRLAATP